MSAWKPLQTPNTKPPFSNKLCTASLIYLLFKTFTIYFALPSGSSPALKPPLNINIWDWCIAAIIFSMDCSIKASFKVLKLIVSTIAPSVSKACLVSNSQFVPLKTGIKTLGFPKPILAMVLEDTLIDGIEISSSLLFVFVGNKLSKVFVQYSIASSISIETLFIFNWVEWVVLPSKINSSLKSLLLSNTMLPSITINKSLLVSISTPILFPKLICAIAAAIPPSLTCLAATIFLSLISWCILFHLLFNKSQYGICFSSASTLYK